MATSGEMSEQQVKDFIKSIITSSPVVSSIQSIQKDYKEMIGMSIPFHKFGYNSVEHFLKNIPDTCVVNGTGYCAQVTLIHSKKSAHINEMVTQQKVNTKKRRSFLIPRRRIPAVYSGVPKWKPPANLRPTYNYAFTPNNSGSSLGNSSSSDNPLKITNNNILNINARTAVVSKQNISNVKNTNTVGVKNQTLRGVRTENTEERRNVLLEQNKQMSLKVKEQLNNLIEQQVQLGNVAKAPTTSPPKNQGTETLNNYNYFNIDNSGICDKYAQLSIREEEDARSFKENRATKEDEYFDRSKERLNNLLSNFKSAEEALEEEDTSNVPKRVQCNLKTLISQFSEGIWVNDVPGHYRRLFRKDLMYMEYGYTSLIEMCLNLKHIFHYVRPGVDDFKLYDRSKPLPASAEKFYTIASYDVEKKGPTEALPELDWADFTGHIPDDVFKYGNEIEREFVPINTAPESVLDVVVVEIYDPSKFWFYLGTSDKTTPLDDLMDKIQTFYNDSENARLYEIPPGALKEGLYCVQIIYEEYHRAKIVRVLDDPDYVRVLYIDYGTVCKAPTKGMCFLHCKFARLNAQAIRCRLANIIPNLKEHSWPRTTSDHFRKLVNRRDTKIKISHIDWNDEYVCAFLADVTNPDNVQYINEILVKEGHALWDGETQVVPFVLSNFTCNVQNLHLFPTFFELEYGLAPNASEMYALEDLLIPLQFCIPRYFKPNDQIISLYDDDDDKIEDIENAFIETVKNHRKYPSFNHVDVSTVVNPGPIDFDVFEDLRDEMIEFCNRTNVGEAGQAQSKDREEELYCDIEDAAEDTLERFKDIERNLKEQEPVKRIQEDRQLSESIIKKLERYSLLDSEHSSFGSEGVTSAASQSSTMLQKFEPLDLEELLSPLDIEQDLSTIYEQSDMELESTGPNSPKQPYFGCGLNRARSRCDVNIFDNPEEFDRTSDASEKSDTVRPVSPESFLRTVERICKNDLEEEISVTEEKESSTENTLAPFPDSENPFKFDINADLREAFKSFLNSQKKSCVGPSSESGSEQEVKSSSRLESHESTEGGSSCSESFLKCKNQNRRLERDRLENDLEKETNLKEGESTVNLLDESNLEEAQGGFVSTLSLNNPFRSYLEVSSRETTDLSTAGTEKKELMENTTLTDSQSTRLTSSTDLLGVGFKLMDAEVKTSSSKASDSDGSDYKVFVPKTNVNRPASMANTEVRQWVQNSMGMSTPPMVATPPRIVTPPRGFTPPNYGPTGFPPYPQWSNGSGYPVPPYPQWNTGGNYPPPNPYMSYPPPPRDILRPPPGFHNQGPSQNFNPYMHPRMVNPGPYPRAPPVYYGPPRHMMPPSISENDFYERYNENILRQARRPC